MTVVLLASMAVAFADGIGAPADGHAYNPAWSPDGKLLAFEINRYEGNVELYVVEVDNAHATGIPQRIVIAGSSSSAFSTSSSVAMSPTWHPQGMLLFEGSTPGGALRLYYWAPKGQAAVELLSTAQVPGDLSWPAVNPDGKQVAFISDSTGAGDVFVWNQAANQVQPLLTSPFSEMAPRFAADGLRVAYSRKNMGGEDLFVHDGGTSTPWIGGNGDQTRPVWAGDGLVYFTNERGSDHWDVAISAAAGERKTLAKDVRLPLRAAPALSPDKQWVAYGLSDPAKAGMIAFTRVDGTRTVEVPTGLVAVGEPAVMSRDGHVYVAFTALPKEGADWRQLQVLDVTDKLR